MIKRLTKHGNSLALVIDRPILELLEMSAETPLNLRTDGECLIITPVRDPDRIEHFEAALKRANRRHGGALKRLAE